ncbi:hypothetical protein K8T06_05830, partial [bacterium]|nr:hypothetical protein [bacterium]
ELMKSGLVFVILVCLSTSLFAAVVNVPGDYPTIQSGINAAVNGDTVLVADGTYTGDGNRDIDFVGKAVTVISENGANSCIIDCEGSIGSPHRGFYFQNSESNTSVLQGFTIQNAYASGSYPDCYGGGIYCIAASPLITDCIFYENEVVSETSIPKGAGIYCLNSNPTIVNCSFVRNIAHDYSGVLQFGGRNLFG